MQRMILSLKMSAEAHARLEQYLAQQQDPASPNFHKWLTPSQFGEQFGPSQDDVDTATVWLLSQGFSIEEVAPSRMSIIFTGTREQVEWAFRTSILDYEIDGQVRHANATDPSIPSALSAIVNGVVTLHNIPRRTSLQGKTSVPSLLRKISGPYPQMNVVGGDHFLAPGDFATIYNVKPLYEIGIDGTGVAIAIVGRSNIKISDITTFRSLFSLPVNNPTVLINGPDPGIVPLGGDEEFEAVLDVTWSGAVAKAATIKFVVSGSTLSADGVDLSAQYIVDHNLAPVMSLSFGLCERDLGTSGNAFYNQLWSQAAVQGITVLVSTGDNGPAGCDSAGAATGTIAAVSGLASTPYNVAVGGTKFNEGSGTYWNPSNASDLSSAIGYIPELPWNESGANGGSQLWAGSGGTSSIYSQPSWQAAPGVPSNGMRNIPDVSLTAAIHDPYALVVEGHHFYGIGGTSAAAPSFAGLMALVVQKYGRQGNPNPIFYRLGNAQYLGTGPAIFHDITSGNISVPGVPGFTAITGYDRATGLGSVDANALVTHWGSNAPATGPTITSQPQSQAVVAGATATFSVAATGSGSLSYQWQRQPPGVTGFSDLPSAINTSYTTPATSVDDNVAQFRVAITDSLGTLHSNPATLGVTSSGTVMVVASSSELATPVGGQLTLTASVAGSPNKAVTWSTSAGTLSDSTANPVTWTAPSTPGATYTATATSQADYTKNSVLTITVKTLDLLGDGGVPDILDLAVLARAYGSKSGDSNWNVGADLNGDGVVDESDLSLFLTHTGF